MSRLIVIIAAGSRGDIQPCVALGQGLTARGDKVRLVASARYEPMVTAAGMEFAALTADPTEILSSAEGQEWLAGGRDPVRFIRNFKRVIGPMAHRLLAEALAASQDADLLLAPTIGFFGEHVGEHLDIPRALIHFQPSQPTGAFPHPLLPQGRLLGQAGNRLSFQAVDQVAWQLLRPFINPWRQRSLGLAKLPLRGPMHRVRRDRRPVLCCFSDAVVPRPADWPSYVHTTGYWFVDAAPDWSPPRDLADFLAAGPPPVYVGFGSMVPADPARTDAVVRAALRRAGLRGVLAGDPAHAPQDDDVLVVNDVPHAWLFPRMAAVVHHGGAGTTAAGLRAGVPTIVCPFFGDQPYWGERVAALGAGPGPLPVKGLTAGRLSAALERTTGSERMRAAATRLGERLSAEDGVGAACDILATL
ncbi:glycosyltransferase [Actinomadura scrupuli]|uniref:glycosyltransferase n=1 Tax=Actinomadura scrupuli TaxID=559629 RepID=UPI003D99DA0D